MKILMFTWEFPPYKVGGIASHCYDLSKALVRMGHDVHILTYGDKEEEDYDAGITIHRVSSTQSAPDIVGWSMYLNQRFEKKAIELNKIERFDVIHIHDWMAVPAGAGLKKILKKPLVFTLHSTERGRAGINTPVSKMINDLEWYGTYEADQIITVGKDFCEEVKTIFSVPEEKIHYIPNGVDIKKFDNAKYTTRREWYAGDWEKMILFVGRLTYQKGVDYLLDAIPKVLNEYRDAKFVFVGDGGGLEHYRGKAWSLGLKEKTYFTGYVPDDVLISLYKVADLTIAPSIYEPFGIVALEAAAANKATVGSYTGGLKETIINEYTGLHTIPANSNSIADQLLRVLWDDNWCRWMGRNGRKMVEKNFKWDRIARWTTGVYGKAMGLWD
ncbi:MAG TPA: glycosyltransferase family 1 protein [Candidatus Aenigmarchaeota archaeon]|nr:MAG: glycosyltransferase family 1 protein [Candidatus Aenigmarchaeota archaeon]HDD45892.1 glycosyltransferase family 1 protein [Candidatus Aenigmarchaeota archaeon]